MLFRAALTIALIAVCPSGCAHKTAQAVAPPPRTEILGTRAAPFAAYITAMHRQIHRLFTLGFLADIDARKDPAFANDKLWVQLEIVVTGDGKVERVGIVRPSGLPAFDVAAIDSVRWAAPFPPPPSAIKSADGKVYLDWQFHRDQRACGTFGVDPHILTTAGPNIEHDTFEAGTQAQAYVTQPVPRAEVSEPRTVVEGWFAAYLRRDPAWLAGWSAVPFTAGGQVVARDGAALKASTGSWPPLLPPAVAATSPH